jgi:hypothetical protein
LYVHTGLLSRRNAVDDAVKSDTGIPSGDMACCQHKNMMIAKKTRDARRECNSPWCAAGPGKSFPISNSAD